MTLTDVWRLEMTVEAEKDFSKLDKSVKQRIIRFFEERVLCQSDPRLYCKALTGGLSGYWSYRVGDYRVIADVRDHELRIIAIKIDHRRKVYDL